MARDVTDCARAEEELRRRRGAVARAEQLRALGQLAAGVAHDVNNNLTAILGPVQLAREALAGGSINREQLLSDLDFIERAAMDAARTLHRLQVFARGAQGPIARPIARPDEVLADVIALTRPRWRDQARAERRQIAVEALPGGAPPVRADPSELREVLVNLVSNAIDAIPQRGSVLLRTGAERGPGNAPELAVLEVRDNGAGMDEATRARLFEPFFTTKAAGKGSGLGLVMVRRIVEDLGGSIAVETAPGRGSTFTVRLPAEVPAAPPGAAPPAAPARARRIMLVEDEAALRAIAARLLRRDGHAVTAVASAEEALQHLESAAGVGYDVVLSDVGLPGLSGWQLAERLRALAPRLPLVLATGWGAAVGDEQLAAIGVGRDCLVPKPYRLEDLRRALNACTAPVG